MASQSREFAIPHISADATYLIFPQPRNKIAVPAGWRESQTRDEADAIILTAAIPDRMLDALLQNVADPLVPVVSLENDRRRGIDAAGSEHVAFQRASEIHQRIQQLHPSMRRSRRSEDILLGRMFVRDADLVPMHDPTLPDFVGYPVAGRLEGVSEIALQLSNRGLLTKDFFDRLNICADCRSARLSVREECHVCRSANLHEETIVHHFRCGHEAPESHFRSGTNFECPKCGHALRHIGLDYDKPGSVVRCGGCDAVNDLPAVGLKCMDCGRHHSGEEVPTRNWYSFKLTRFGIRHLLEKRADDVVDADKYATHPHAGSDAFRVLLEQVLREQREFQSSFQVVRLSVLNADEIRAANIRLWKMSVDLIHDALHSALREVDVVRQESDDTFLLLLPRTDRRGAEVAARHIVDRCEKVLKIDARLAFTALDEVEIRSLRHEGGARQQAHGTAGLANLPRRSDWEHQA
jgi:hypothetical protein